jgi:anaerobic ribonucleoside-triphosphate reductase activating protein
MRGGILLNIRHIAVTEGVNGPGKRLTVWAQGCPFSCEGCFNPELRPFEEKRLYSPEKLLEEALALDFTGVTLSGGEPFAQADKLADFLLLLKAERPKADVIAFTGHTLKELKSGPLEFKKLLCEIDLLVDGRYEQQKPSAGGLRGSANQRLVPLTETGINLLEGVLTDGSPSVALTVTGEGEVIISGFPDPEFVRNLRQKLSG